MLRCMDCGGTAQQTEVEEYGQSGQPISAYLVVFMS